MHRFSHLDVTAEWDEHFLCVGNSLIRRKMDISKGYPSTVELTDLATCRELATPSDEIDFFCMGYNLPGTNDAHYKLMNIDAKIEPDSVYEAEHVVVTLTMEEPQEGITYRREIRIHPATAAISVQNFITAAVMPNVYWTYRTRLRCDENRASCNKHIFSAVDAISFVPELSNRFAVEFLGRTDDSDVQVFERRPGGDGACGNLLYITGANGAGAVILQEAPPSAERRDMEKFDFNFGPANRVWSCCWGFAPGEIRPGVEFRSYRHTVMTFGSEFERRTAVFSYLRRRYPERPSDHVVMVNPWGCGDFPNRTGEQFLCDEIAASADKFSAECYQIDDSWQQGGSLWRLIAMNHFIAKDFWDISTTTLNGTMHPMKQVAEQHGIELALWTAPSFNVEYRDWRDFVEMVLRYHREYGFRFFKVDSMALRSYEAERNIEAAFRAIRDASDGKVMFNLDVTNGQRGGYFFFLEYGNLFLENRYVSLGWGIGYHPEKTLRSLWRLAKYTRAQYLQIEIPCRPQTNHARAAVNPSYHVMPDVYSWSYWGAVALFANPLLWFAPSLVEESECAELRAVIELHQRHRDKIFAGDILPVGPEPDGRAVTGFWSRRAGGGMIAVYREYGCSEPEAKIELGETVPALTTVGGEGFAEPDGTGIKVNLPSAGSFALFEYTI